MKIIECEQRSPEWFAARAGILTSSQFKTARSTTRKGEPTAEARKLAFKLALERVAGQPLDYESFSPWQADRGTMLEPVALELYLRKFPNRRAIARQVGFVLTTDENMLTSYHSFGCSPDCLIGDFGGVEIKCFLDPLKLEQLLLNQDYSCVIDQIQGNLMITCRQYWNLVLYCPALAPIGQAVTVIPFERDIAYCDELRQDLRKFNSMVFDYVDRLYGCFSRGDDQRPLIESVVSEIYGKEEELSWS